MWYIINGAGERCKAVETEIEAIAKEYDPKARLSLFVDNGHYHVNNQYWDKTHPAIDSFRIKEV